MNVKQFTFFIITMFLFSSLLHAGEGMWLPQLLKSLNEKEMKSMGMKISAEDVYSINKGSLKDAIVRFGGGCSSEVISSQGLLLTNHHCGYGQIQSHSSVANNLLKNGFWAKTQKDELPNSGLTATFIDRIDDVTKAVLSQVDSKLSHSDRQKAIMANIEKLRTTYKLESYQELIVRPFFDGNQYFAFVTTIFKDVRLVGTPPESIGKFGADTDNWVWPRHTGDFALFRIYADKNNKPADYSAENVPYKPKHFFPISLDGVEEGDFTMVFGFPGRTTQYLPSSAVKQILNTLNPARIAIRDFSLKTMDKYMREDEAIKIKYASKYASIANAWKKWIGESQGLNKSGGVNKKVELEKEFQSRLKSGSPYQSLLSELHRLYADIDEVALAREYFIEVTRNVEILNFASSFKALVAAYEKNGEQGYKEEAMKQKGRITNFYKNFDAKIDQEKLAGLLTMYVDNLKEKYVPIFLQRDAIGLSSVENYNQVANELFMLSEFETEKDMIALIAKNGQEATSIIKKDPMYALAVEWEKFYQSEINLPYTKLNDQISRKLEVYTQAQLEVFPEKRFYPDANGTMRITYGNVNGYQAKDAVYFNHVTYIDGVVDKYVPGDYEFDLDEKYRMLYANKDFGMYKDKNGKLPVNFIASNHTTGGNSGSPALDAYGNLIGLNFDRVWEGTMSDINYDASICRNIMVDARYILWVIDKYADAGHLVEEMKLVNPKAKSKSKKK